MCVNARSIVNKIDDLQALISVENPDIFGITESWTHDGILDAELSVNGYTLFRCDRPLDNRGGGVLLYVRSEYHPCEYRPNSRFPEQIWCQLSISLQNLCYLAHATGQHRPHLEYCCSAWSPRYVKDKECLEKSAAQFYSVIQRLERLGLHQSIGPPGFMDTGRT